MIKKFEEIIELAENKKASYLCIKLFATLYYIIIILYSIIFTNILYYEKNNNRINNLIRLCVQ